VTEVTGIGWATRPLGDLVEVLDRLRKPITKKDRKSGPYPYYGATGILDHVDGYLFDESLVLIGEDGAKWEAGASSAFAISGRTWVNNHAHVIRPKRDRILDDWLIYYLNGADLMPFVSGMTVPKLNQGRLREILIPLPPLEEQQRIVAILDEAFEGLARARVHAEANLQNARELFEASLSAFIDRRKDSWSSTTLGEEYDVRDGTHDSPKYHPTGRALITSKNLGRDGLHFEKVKFISEEDYDSICRRSGVDKGDVLFAMIGTIGNPIVVDVEPDFAIKNVALFKMKKRRNGQFLRYMLRSKYVVEKMQAEAKGTTQQFVGLGYLRSFPILLPEPTTELTMIDELDRIEVQCRLAEALYDIKLQGIDDLRQSLLQKAFAGELT